MIAIVAKKEDIRTSRKFARRKYRVRSAKLTTYKVKIIPDSFITVEADSDDEWEDIYPGTTGRYLVKKFEIVG